MKNLATELRMMYSAVMQFVLIGLLTALLRLFRIEYTIFNFDQIQSWHAVAAFYTHPGLIYRGMMSSTGIYNFPFFDYLLSLVSVFSRNPLYLSVCISVLNIIVLSIFPILFRKHYHRNTVLAAMILLGVSPWMVQYSRFIWSQNLLLVFLIPAYYMIHEIVLRHKYSYIYPLLMLLVLITQLHLSGFLFSIITVLVLINRVVRNHTILFTKILQYLSVGLLPLIPFIIFQVRADPTCPDCIALANYAATPKSYDARHFLMGLQILNGNWFDYFISNNSPFYSLFTSTSGRVLSIIFYLENVLLFYGVYIIIKYLRNYIFLLWYLILTPLLYFLTKTEFYMHYYIITAIPLAFVYAIAISRLVTRHPLRLAGFIIIIVIHTFFSLNYFSLQKQTPYSYDQNFIPLKHKLNSGNKLTLNYLNRADLNEIKMTVYQAYDEINAHESLARYFYRGSDLAQAAYEMEQIEFAYQNDDSFHIALGNLYIDIGRIQDANKQYLKIKNTDTPKARILSENLGLE